jgi:hypothetical protein
MMAYWQNIHLFQFCEKDLSGSIGYGIQDDLDSDTEIVDARKTKMTQIFKKPGQKYHYIYDFGDHWKHQITFEKMEVKEMSAPYCIGGEGACPPEDVWGEMHGYHEMLAALQRPGGKERKEYIQWLGLAKGEKWDPNFCSIREVNKRLALL